MKRRNFLRNAMMAIAVSLVPKILQPVEPVVNNYYERWLYEILDPKEHWYTFYLGREGLQEWEKFWKESFNKQQLIQ